MTAKISEIQSRARKMQRRTTSKLLAAVAVACGGLLSVNSVKGATNYIWQAISAGNASGNWSTPANWNPNLPVGGTTGADSVDFSQLNIVSDSTIGLNAPQTIGNLTFGDTDTSTLAGWNINATAATANNTTDVLTLAPGTPTITVLALGAGKSATINATLSNGNATGWGLAKAGAGILTLTARDNSLTGTIYINNGTLSLDFSQAWSPLTNIIGHNSQGSVTQLDFQGGMLNLIGSPGMTNSQTFPANTNVDIGAAAVTFNQNNAASLSLALGTLTRSVTSGATLDVTLPTAGAVTATSTTSTHGLVVDGNGSAYVTVNGGSDWAAISGANLVGGISALGFYTPSTSISLAGNANLVTNSTLTTSTTVATIRQGDAAGPHTIDLGSTHTLTTGGILMTPAAGGTLTIQNGSLTAGPSNAADIMISQNNTNFPLNISAAIINNGANTTELTKDGAGTLTLSGNNTYNGNTYINGGALSITGGTIGPAVDAAPFPAIQIAPADANTATVNISGTAVINDDRFIVAGNSQDNAGGRGTVNMTGGTINSSQFVSVGLLGSATLDQSGGTINVVDGFASLEIGVLGASSGVVNLSGTAHVNLQNGSSVVMGHLGTTGNGTLDQNGGTVTFYSDGGATVGGTGIVDLGASGTGIYTYNLNAGTLTAPAITHGSGAGILNFNGGTLAAAGNSTAFISNLTAANVLAGGAMINTNGFTVTVPQPLIHASSLGATIDGGLTKVGTGTLILSSAATYTGPTKVTGGILRLPPVIPPPIPVASYSFDTVDESPSTVGTVLSPGQVVNNGGSGGAAMNGMVDTANWSGFGAPSGLAIVAGKFGHALQFDGMGSSVDVTSNITDMSGNAIWTMSLWVQTNEPGSTFVSKNSGTTTWGTGDSVFYLGSNPPSGTPGGLPTAERFGGGFAQGGTAVNDGAWHLLTYVDNGGAKSIYVDGNLTTLTQTQFTATDTSTGVRIGFDADSSSSLDGNVNYFGNIDELKFYNAALTQIQIQDLFANNTITHSFPPAGQLLPTSTPVNLSVSGATLDLSDANQTIGSLTGVAGSSVTLGAGNLTTGGDNSSQTFAGNISGTGGGLVKAGTGTFTLTGANTYTGPTTVTAGTLIIGAAGALPVGTNLNIANASKVNVVNHGANPKILLQLSSLSTLGTATLDLSNNDMIVHNGILGTVTTAGSITNEIAQGRGANGLWTGPGITSSAAAATPGETALGVELNNNGAGGTFFTTFDGQTVTNTDVLVKYTFAGDADLSGTISSTDYILIDNGFNSGGTKTGWRNGDFNYDGNINGDDYTLIDNAFNTQGSTSFASSSAGPTEMIAADTQQISSPTIVPEPTGFGFLALSIAGSFRRKRRN